MKKLAGFNHGGFPVSVLVVMAVTAAVWSHQTHTNRFEAWWMPEFVASAQEPKRTATGASMAFTLETKSFTNGREIPRKFTCDGEDLSPELSWSEPPPAAQSLALIADDPDAPSGTWTHWVAYDIPPQNRELPEGAGKGQLPGGGQQGKSDFGKTGYGGPCPPPGKAHRYYFKLYALDARLNLKSGATKQELETAMKGHVLAQAEIMGTYKR